MNTNTLDSNQLKANLGDSRIWLRLVFMALFVIMLNISGVLMWGICLVQFVFVAATGATNPKLLSLGASLGRYIHQVLDFLSFNTEQRAFPFADWPFADRSFTESGCAGTAEKDCRQQAPRSAETKAQDENNKAKSDSNEVIVLGRDSTDNQSTDNTNPPQ